MPSPHKFVKGFKARGATSKLINRDRFQMTEDMHQIEQDKNLTNSLLLGSGSQLLTENGEARA